MKPKTSDDLLATLKDKGIRSANVLKAIGDVPLCTTNILSR
jgi:hypothetical protein